MSARTVSNVSFVVAAIDLWLAVVCAATGNAAFAGFMVLAGLMWAHGIYFKARAEKEGE